MAEKDSAAPKGAAGHKYDATSIKVLGGLGSSALAPRDVYRLDG